MMKTPDGRGQKLLYLDFDGVLHPEDVYRHPRRGIYFGKAGAGHHLFENRTLLATVLGPYQHVKIILSTSWVRVFSYSRARAYLPNELKDRVAGATFHSSMSRSRFESLTRAEQILEDVQRRRPSAWLAIDDDSERWPAEALPHFVESHPVFGCSARPVFEDFIRKLASNFRS